MGFNKKYINRDNILFILQELDNLLKADALIIEDAWSESFIKKYRKLHKKIKQHDRLNFK